MSREYDPAKPLFQPDFTDGLHLGQSRDPDAEGAVRGGAYDDAGNLQEHANWYEVDPPRQRDGDWKEALIPLLAAAVTYAAIKAGPPMIAWWRLKALPGITSTWRSLTGLPVPARQEAVIGELVTTELNINDAIDQFEVARRDPEKVLSSEEARRSLVLLLIALGVAAEQLRTLQGARIVDDALGEIITSATSQDVVALTNQILELDGPKLGRDENVVLLDLFGGGAVVDGQYQPLEQRQVKRALRLSEPGGESAVPSTD